MALVVVTGGIRSGKSAAAQNLAEARMRDGGPVVAVTFGRASDAEMADRISRHQAERPEEFRTLEVEEPGTAWLVEADPDQEALLVVDCLGTALGLAMEAAWTGHAAPVELGDADSRALPEGYAHAVSAGFDELLDALLLRSGDTLVVTNEVGMSLVPLWASGRLFTDLLGRGNRRLIGAADSAYLCVAGRLVHLSELSGAINWPDD